MEVFIVNLKYSLVFLYQTVVKDMKEKGKSLLLIYLTTLLLVSTAVVSVRSSSEPNVFVDPPVIVDSNLVPGENFTINIRIANVTEMWSFRVDLGWGPPIVEVPDNPGTPDIVEGVTEGPFLGFGGDTYFRARLYPAKGILSVSCNLLSGGTWQSGSGILFTVKFTVGQVGATALDIYYSTVRVKGPPPQYLPTPIDHTSEDGFFSNVLGGNYGVAITDVTTSKTIVCQGYSADVNITVQNQGNVMEGFVVNAYCNSSSFGAEGVALSMGASTTLTLTWDTIGFAKEIYTISANASIFPNETLTGDNTYIDGTVRVNMVGDMNSDKKVSITDIVIIALAFGSKPGDPNWNPNADLNNDGKVSITDVVIAAIHFGETDP